MEQVLKGKNDDEKVAHQTRRGGQRVESGDIIVLSWASTIRKGTLTIALLPRWQRVQDEDQEESGDGLCVRQDGAGKSKVWIGDQTSYCKKINIFSSGRAKQAKNIEKQQSANLIICGNLFSSTAHCAHGVNQLKPIPIWGVF